MSSGDTLCVFTPYNNEPPSANYATLDTRNQHPVLDFDDTTDEYAIFTGVLPRAYAGSGLTVYVHWAATSATSGNVIWAGQFEACAAQDIDSDGFASAVTASASAANGTSGIPTVTNFAFTDGAQIDSLAVGGLFRFALYRDANNGSDTMTGDAELLAIEVKET